MGIHYPYNVYCVPCHFTACYRPRTGPRSVRSGSTPGFPGPVRSSVQAPSLIRPSVQSGPVRSWTNLHTYHQQSLAKPPNQIGDLLAVIFKKLPFKGTELDLNGTESAENLKLPILLLTTTCLLFARLNLFKRALKQLKRCREEYILARVLTIGNHLEL